MPRKIWLNQKFSVVQQTLSRSLVEVHKSKEIAKPILTIIYESFRKNGHYPFFIKNYKIQRWIFCKNRYIIVSKRWFWCSHMGRTLACTRLPDQFYLKKIEKSSLKKGARWNASVLRGNFSEKCVELNGKEFHLTSGGLPIDLFLTHYVISSLKINSW